jgi:hypothetical protein
MITKITGNKHHDLSAIADCIVPGNAVFVLRDDAWHKEPENGCDGIAYRCETKGVVIGYLPLLRTLRKYMAEAYSEEARERIRRWGLATKAIRQQLFIDYGNLGTERWVAKVAGLLYFKEGKWLEFEEFTQLTPEEQSGWKLEQVSINFPDILEF